MTDRYRDLWREVSRGEKVLAAGLVLLVAGFSLAGAGLVLLVAGDEFLADPYLLTAGGGLVLAGGLTIGAAGVMNEHDERRLRREREGREVQGAVWTYWSQEWAPWTSGATSRTRTAGWSWSVWSTKTRRPGASPRRTSSRRIMSLGLRSSTLETRAGGENMLKLVRRYAWVPVFVGASVVYVWRRVR